MHDLAAKAWDKGLDKVIDALGDQYMTIGTMCSGTESPILGVEQTNRCNYSFP
jgi:hypothetical protein